MKIALIVLTLNAGPQFKQLLKTIAQQSITIDIKLVIDSSSEDDTVHIARGSGYEVICIKREQFNHGATRQYAASLIKDVDILIYLTQDIILANQKAIGYLLDCFKDIKVGAAYGRQLPRHDAGAIAAHARLFNYPYRSRTQSTSDIACLGIKTAFLSNSFAAYRRTALEQTGGFPADIILGEDTYVAAKMLLLGWKICYCAEAQVYHSHDYTVWQEFKRYFDIGVFHSRERWLLETFGKAEGEGLKYVMSELKYLWHNGKYLIPKACLQNLFKIMGYKLGLAERWLPVPVKQALSMNKNYWLKHMSPPGYN